MWTGDMPPHDVWNQTQEENLKVLKKTHNLINEYFKDYVKRRRIFSAVGNHESFPMDRYQQSWLKTNLIEVQNI